jgi:pimeloyl-ACP methyl ester carboxylesterase
VSVDEHTIELAGSPVFYRQAPAPGVTALYLHGIPTSSDDWMPFLERIGGIAPDLIGFGRSGKGAHLDYSLEGHLAFLEAFLTYLGIDHLQLVLHDWGAVPGLVFAARNPERVRGLVIVNAVPLSASFTWPRLVHRLRRPLLGELLMGATTRGLLARMLRRGGPLSDERVQQIWRQFDQGTQRAILRLYRAVPETRLAAASQSLDRLESPALVLWGERDPWLGPELAQAFGARVPDATVRRFPDAGHWPWLEQPALIEQVSEFLGHS